jgi:hypothetical protein
MEAEDVCQFLRNRYNLRPSKSEERSMSEWSWPSRPCSDWRALCRRVRAAWSARVRAKTGVCPALPKRRHPPRQPESAHREGCCWWPEPFPPPALTPVRGHRALPWKLYPRGGRFSGEGSRAEFGAATRCQTVSASSKRPSPPLGDKYGRVQLPETALSARCSFPL